MSRRSQRAAAASKPKAVAAPARKDYRGLVDDHTAYQALLGMATGTDDPELNRIRAEHGACQFDDCAHLAAFWRHEERILAMGRRWTMEPEPRHQRKARP